MMGAYDLFKEVLGDFPDGDISNNTQAAKALIKAGLAVLLVEPQGKKPVCTLTARQAKTADDAAQATARANGTKNWNAVRHDCGVYHAITDPKELTKAKVKELLAAGCNLAVVPGMSMTRVIVVDEDTKEERRGFLEDWARATGEKITDLPGMTVSSPGVMSTEVDGRELWAHKDGGHHWLTVPANAEEFPTSPGKLRGASGWTVYYGSGYVLVPPSVRKEGAYRLTGPTVEAPEWLLAAIQAGGTSGGAEALRERIRAGETDQDIDSWSANTPWPALLGAYAWTPTGRLDTCGCPTWTRPGSPVHDKSATAHEVGCPQYTTDTGHAPIHAWSDAVSWGGRKTVTKLTFLAHEGYGGNMRAAMDAIGVEPNTGHVDLIWDPMDEDEAPKTKPSPSASTAPAGDEPDGDDVLDFSDPDEVEGVTAPKAEEGETDGDEPGTWRPRDLTAILTGTVQRVEPTLLPRSDGHALLYPGKVHSFHGESESGKSLVLMGEAVRLMREGQDVLWITFDSDEEEDVARALRFGATAEEIQAHLHYIRPEVAPKAEAQAYRDMMSRPYGLAVIDGVVDAMGLILQGAKGDPNEVYSEFFRRFPKRLADRTGAATVLVDHVTKDTDSRGRFAIGAQAKMAALTGAAYLVEPDKDAAPTAGLVGAVVLRVGKDRPAGVRRYCGPRRARDRTQEAARITIDDTGDFTIMTVEPPELDPFVTTDAVEGPPVDLPLSLMATISEFLADKDGGLSKGSVEKAVKGNAGRKRLAIEMLEKLGYLRVEDLGRGKPTVLTLLEPYYLEYGDCPAGSVTGVTDVA